MGLCEGGVGSDVEGAEDAMRASNEAELSPSTKRCARMKHAAAMTRTSKSRQTTVRYLQMTGQTWVGSFTPTRNSEGDNDCLANLRVMCNAPRSISQSIFVLHRRMPIEEVDQHFVGAAYNKVETQSFQQRFFRCENRVLTLFNILRSFNKLYT